jgi:arylsulfatase A-like enzyme
MKRILMTCVLAGLGSAVMAAAEPKAAMPPNILMIAVDDLKPMLGCYGDAEIKTPNIDQLAARGTVFLNNACQQAVCGPSRASLMTGTYPDTTGVYDLKTKMREANPDTLTLPEYLKSQGYETTGCGKIYDPRCVDSAFDEPSWSIPFEQNSNEECFAEGFTKSQGGYHSPEILKESKALKAYMKENGISKKDREAYTEAMRKFALAKPVSECLDVPDDAYDDGAFANRAIQQMEELAKGKKPFFLAVGFKKPHLPFVAPKKYWDLYDRSTIKIAEYQQMPEGAPEYHFQDSWELYSGYSGIPTERPWPMEFQLEMIHGYRAATSYADAQVGKLLRKLEALGLAENTIVVLWGDHGWHLGDHGMWCKHTNYEQAVRSPLIMAAPGQKTKGAKTESPAEFVDIFPTLCELAGLPIPERVEGISLVPVLDDSAVTVREAALGQFPRGKDKMGYTLRDKRYRYIKWVKMDYYAGERAGPMVDSELYDLEKDPLETVNQASNPEYAEVVANFEKLFKIRKISQEK